MSHEPCGVLHLVVMTRQVRSHADVEALTRQLPGWADQPIEIAQLHGGITNTNFIARVAGQPYVIRIPGERTELLGIDRANEAEAATRAAQLGIGPAVVGELPGIGTLITALVPGRHLDPVPFTDHLHEVVGLLHAFHRSGPLRGAFPIHRVVEWHARDASSYGVVPPPSYGLLHQQSRRIEAAFAVNPLPTVPCHNDLLPGNVLFDDPGERVWLLDFEYAGMNDLFFDLGNLSVNCGLDTAGDETLLRLYFGEVTAARWARLQLMKMMSEFREGMWAVVQQAISTLDTDFVAYATERLGNCERLATQPQFEQWLTDAAGQVG
jgi:thiamine kinase-like enzyme